MSDYQRRVNHSFIQKSLENSTEYVKKEPEQATKHDNKKPDLSLLPYNAIEEVTKALQFGADKYGKYNYKGGFDNTRLTSASMRHIMQYLNGEDNDPESGYSHIAHAVCNLMFLIDQTKRGKGTDGRFKETK